MLQNHNFIPHPSKDWSSFLRKPGAHDHQRSTEYPLTALGQLAYHLRELFDRREHQPRPTPKQLYQTAHLVHAFSQELRSRPLTVRSPIELALINYVVTPRDFWGGALPHAQVAWDAVHNSFLESQRSIIRLLKHSWSHPELIETVNPLQQIALNLSVSRGDLESLAALVRRSLPNPGTYKPHYEIAPGSVAMLSISHKLGVREASHTLFTEALKPLLTYESLAPFLCPLSRPHEFRFISFALSGLLQARIQGVKTNASLHMWEPTWSESVDITRSWMEGSSRALLNFFKHLEALKEPEVLTSFAQLYCHRGIRNILRLKLSECDTPWFLVESLVQSCRQPQFKRDVILCAITTKRS